MPSGATARTSTRDENDRTQQTENYPEEFAKSILRNLAKPEVILEVQEAEVKPAKENPVLAITKEEETAWEQLDKSTQKHLL